MESRDTLAGHLPNFVTESASLIAATTSYEMQILQYLFLGHQRPKLHFDSNEDADAEGEEEVPNCTTHTWIGTKVAGVCGVIWSFSEFGMDLIQILRGQYHVEQGPTGPVFVHKKEDDQDEETKPYKTQEPSSTKEDHPQNGRPSTDTQDRQDALTEPVQVDAAASGNHSPAVPKAQRESKGTFSSSASLRSLSSMLSRKSSDQQPVLVRENNNDENVVLLAGSRPEPEVIIGDNDSSRRSQPVVIQEKGGDQTPAAASSAKSGDSSEALDTLGTDKSDKKKNKKKGKGETAASPSK
ncbi:hypothetical protein B0O80DRAFT_486406 [Mortierella sp. GBAus27b]|nr:hypothetical protein BGX31_011289 [Mortierella sp. GBA43]KAI8355884.1 hypothetical protein B0O80DRAFT_486406 [Mortierella sp. GBAus27b]